MQVEYKAINNNGAVVSGVIEAETLREANRKLHRQGLKVTSSISKQQKTKLKKGAKPAKQQDLHLALHQLTVLLKSGVSLGVASQSISDSNGSPFLSYEFGEIARKLRSGSQFSTALQESKLSLPLYIYHLTKAGELTGNLAGSLREGVDQMEYEQKLEGELKNALIYPSILVTSGIGAVLLIFIIVVPKFSSMLDKNTGSIPLLARVVLGTGKFFNENTLQLGITVGSFLGLILLLKSQSTFKQKLWDTLLHIPLLGPWLIESDIGRWAGILSTLLKSKVELTHSLELAQSGVKSSRLKANLAQVTQAVKSGNNLADSLLEADTITATGYDLIKVGEQTGELAGMLHSLSALYADSGRQRMKRFLLLLEPIAILSIGSIIGLIMAGIILAITSVNEIPM